MNEFEWLRQMRGLNQSAPPPDDLWARIDAALDAAEPSGNDDVVTPIKPPRRHLAWVVAASLAATFALACGITWREQPIQSASNPSIAALSPGNTAPWKPSDPRLAGAAVELDAARMELQQAIQQAPDSPALQRLLQRTDAQQSMLRELEKHAG
ncbi:hypothetical protein [Dyella mobilis]|uniref:Anti-sigma factor n=1 Tax=Dyella mobilis TaxID=1849582 RepID=A0ABS2KMD1_9GAMM|nr:hypothetical protein [Dyella mobilis]MBM7132318.1 hypothetical protein [Dyella mobilis]GLQ95695.1 hypothetical protein GCM10007863_01130 [Dyella mobilis]